MKYTSRHIREGNLIKHHNPSKEEKWPAKLIIGEDSHLNVGYLYSDKFNSKSREYFWTIQEAVNFLNNGIWILVEEVSNNYEVYD